MKNIFFVFLIGVFSISFAQEYPEKFEENGKFGIKYQGKIVLSSVYDEINYHPIIVAYKGKERSFYDHHMNLLHKNDDKLTYAFFDEYNKIQVITKDRKLYSYDEDGLITDPLKLNPNETITEKKYDDSFYYTCDTYTISKDLIVNEVELSWRHFDIEYNTYGKKIKFLNNKRKMLIEHSVLKSDTTKRGFSEEAYFEPLSVNYIVSKVKNKYGVYDFFGEKIILSYEYQKIIPFRNYLILKKNGLYTFYPNFGTETKYKKLEPFIGVFARFEAVDGRKGWVHWRGKEYYDDE